MTHPKLAVVLAAVLVAGGASTALAQRGGAGHAPSPGTGGGGTSTGAGMTPTPGIGNSVPSNTTPTPGIGTTSNPSGVPNGGPSSAGTPSDGTSSDKTPNAARIPHSIGDTADADIKAEYEERLPYKPCPASVRFPNGQQVCLGGP
jgi:hypothetical protein